MEFEIKLDYAKEDLAAYWRSFVWKKPGQRAPAETPPGVLRFGGWFFIVAGVISVIAAPLLMGDLNFPGLMGLLLCTPLGGVLELVVGWTLLRQSRWSMDGPIYPRWVERAWKKYQESGELYSCRFTDDGVWVHDSKSDHRYDYEFIEALWEDGNHFYLVLSSKTGSYILNKAKFTDGDPAGLPAFWRLQTGKPVEQIQ